MIAAADLRAATVVRVDAHHSRIYPLAWVCFRAVQAEGACFLTYQRDRWEDVRTLCALPAAELDRCKPYLRAQYEDACVAHALRWLGPTNGS